MVSSDSNSPVPGRRAATFLVVAGITVLMIVAIGAVLHAGAGTNGPASARDVMQGIRHGTGSGWLGLGVMLVLGATPSAMLIAAVEIRKQSPRSRWVAAATLAIFVTSIMLALL